MSYDQCKLALSHSRAKSFRGKRPLPCAVGGWHLGMCVYGIPKRIVQNVHLGRASNVWARLENSHLASCGANQVSFGAIGAMRVVLESGARRAACSAPWAGSCEPPGCCAFADMNFVMGRRGYGGRYSIWPSWLFSSPTGAALAPAPGAGLGRCPRRRGARSV